MKQLLLKQVLFRHLELYKGSHNRMKHKKRLFLKKKKKLIKLIANCSALTNLIFLRELLQDTFSKFETEVINLYIEDRNWMIRVKLMLTNAPYHFSNTNASFVNFQKTREV